MFLLIGSNIIFNIIEYFTFINLFLLFLFIIISIFYVLINSTLLYYSNISFSHCLVEFISTLFSLLFLIIIISPALIIMLDFDLIIIPSFILYSLGIQWAWQFNIIFSAINVNYETFCDHYIISSKKVEIIDYPSIDISLLSKEASDLNLTAIPSLFIKGLNNMAVLIRTAAVNIWHYYTTSYYWLYTNRLSDNPIFTYDRLLDIIRSLYKNQQSDCSLLYNNRIMTKNRPVNNYPLVNIGLLINPVNIILPVNIGIVITSQYLTLSGRLIIPIKPNNIPVIQLMFNKYLIEINQYILLPIYSFIRLYVYSFDVIHTLGFYSWGIKIDAIPGRINLATTLRLLSKGEYRGKCFELCGQGHLSMLLLTIIM